MSNNVSALVKAKYTKEVQSLLEESLVSFTLANTTLLSAMPDGNTINYPRPSYSSTAQYVKYTDVVSNDVTFSNETLVINKHPYVSFVIDMEDEQDIGYDVIAGETRRNAFLLKEEIDWDFFSEYANAGTNNGTAVTLTSGATQNVTATYGTAYATLANNGVDTGRVGVVVDPFQINMIGQAALGNTYNTADASYKNGYTGWVFQNMKVFISNNLTCEWVLNLSTIPNDGNTVTVNGVVFTFKTTLGTAEGNVLIGANVSASNANLVAAINEASGAGTTYVNFTDKTREMKLRGLTASTVASTVKLVSKRGYKAVTSTLTGNAADKWGALTIHNIIMEQWAIHLVMRNEVMLKTEDVQKQLGKRFISHTRYGIKTFTEGSERMYDLRIIAQAAM